MLADYGYRFGERVTYLWLSERTPTLGLGSIVECCHKNLVEDENLPIINTLLYQCSDCSASYH